MSGVPTRPPPPVVVRYTEPGTCPFCGSRDLTTLAQSTVLETRTGCLACDRWLTPETPRRSGAAARAGSPPERSTW
jgi:transcription elongation factor Elf1